MSAPDTNWLSRTAAVHPDAVALVLDDGRTVTYGRMDDLAARAATAWSRMFGVEPGGVAGLAVAGSRLETIAAMWGAWRLGAATMVVDARSPQSFVDRWRASGISGFPTTLPLDGTPAPAPPELDAGAPHTVVLTSGGAGEPRAVVLTHGNVAAAVAASAERLGNSADDRWLLALPLFHVGGLSILWRSAAAGGAVVVHREFDAGAAARAMRTGEVTMASLVPTMLHRILEVDSGPYPPGMRAVLLGGAPAGRDLVERALDAGLPILQTYGMTETCSQLATVAPGEERAALGTTGRPLSGMEVTIDPSGEIIVDGPAVSPGYLGEPGRRGGHHTGDIGHLDASGRLVVVGRKDDMVVTGGENVHPARVAQVLAGLPGIDRVEVVGFPDPEWGEALAAIIVGARREPGLRAEATRRLARHEVPKRWVFVDELPLLPNGKVDRARLRLLAER